MKKLIVLIIINSLFGSLAYSQLGQGTFENNWGISVFSKNGSTYTLYNGQPIEATIMYRDTDNQVIYTENQEGILNENSFIQFTIGKGINPQPPQLLAQDFKRISNFDWTITVNTDNGPKVVTGSDAVKPGIFSSYSNVALNSENFSGNSFSTQAKEPAEVFNSEAAFNLLLQGYYQADPTKSVICPFPLDKVFHYGTATSILTGEQVNMAAIGTGLHCPTIFNSVIPASADNFYTAWIPALKQFRNGVRIDVEVDTNSSFSTNGMLVANRSAFGIGARFEGGTLGGYGIGKTGFTGLGFGTAPATVGVYGLPYEAPATGNVAYGILGNGQNFPFTYAAFFSGGDVMATGDVISASDARLKTEVRSQSYALDKVMKLRPASYNYRQDTPYGFPEELHHGFIAQELEEVFPELVSEMRLPLSLDPEKISTSGTIDYKGINYTGMIAILTGALQELNTTLTAKMDAQAVEIAELKKLLQNSEGHK